MRIPESCAICMYDKQQHRSKDEEFLNEVRHILDHRGEEDTSPYMVYLFNQAYERRFGKISGYAQIKKKYNDLVLSMERDVEERIESSRDPLLESMILARTGNYIDFGAMNEVDVDTFLSLLEQQTVPERDMKVYKSFLEACTRGKEILLITDNCGEIVLDKLMIRQLKKRFPNLHVTVLVRGEEVLNDATPEDAVYVGLDREAKILSNGLAMAGTVLPMLPEEAKKALENSDVILSKGQGNYESLCGQGLHIFYAFLCKCELFMDRFRVPQFTGMFVEEK